jgi:hypothetical protein
MGGAEVYAERGFGRRSGAGERPALVVVDLVNGFTDPASPLWCDADAAGPHDAALFDIDAKYGDVVATDDAVALLRGDAPSRAS